MSYSGDAAEQVVRMSLEGAEVAAKITGAGAKQVAVLLYAILREQKKTKGKTRLTNMLRSGKELKVFAVKDTDLKQFCEASKKYGVLWSGVDFMTTQQFNRRVAAVKTADAINAIEGAPVSDYARMLSLSWAKGEITGEQMKSALMSFHRKIASQVHQNG